MTIDVHAHCIPLGLVEELERENGLGIDIVRGERGTVAHFAGRVEAGPLRPDLSDLDARLAMMDRAGIRTQLLSSWIDLTGYALRGEQGARYARMFNESLAATAGRAQDRFRTLCTVPLQAPERAAAELRHAVGQLGMVGVEIAATVDGTELDAADLDPFWAAAQELRCLVLVHPYSSLGGRLTRHFLGNMVGNPAETTIAIASIVFGGVLERFPDLRICAVHGGGFAPWQGARWDRGFAAGPPPARANLTRPPGEWLRRLYYDTVLHDPARIRALVQLVGVDQVVLGSDYPFEMGDLDPVTTVGAVPDLSSAERDQILQGNLQRLLDEVVH